MEHRLGAAGVRALAAGALLLAACPPAHATITPEAARVVDRYLQAVGGAAAVRGGSSTHARATLEAFGLTGDMETWAHAPQSYATRSTIGPFTVRDGCDGSTCWKTDPSGKAALLDGKELDEALSEAWLENDRWLMPDQGGGKVAVVKEPAAADTAVVLEVTPPSGRLRRYWFSSTTGLLVRSTARRDQSLVTTVYGDYRAATAVAGGAARRVPWYERIEIEGMAANTVTARYQAYEVGGALPDSLFAAPAAGGAPVTFLEHPGMARLPFEYLGRHVWLRASINGQPPADFLFDTGASITVIDSAYAAKIGLVRAGSLQSQGAGAAGSAALSSIDKLRIEGPDGDGVEMRDQRVAILSVNQFLAPFFWRDCAGVVGYDFISRFVDEIDFDGGVLTLRDPAGFTYAGKGTALPMRLAGTAPVVTMTIDGKYTGEFRLDVGSSSTVDVHGPFVRANGLDHGRGPAIHASGGGFGGSFPITVVRMKSIALGSYTWKDPIVSLAGAEAGALASEDYAGNVGNQILERFRLTLDYEHKQVWLEPGARFGERDVFPRSGTQFARIGDTLQVMQVLPGSAGAKAGLAAGDEVLAIDGRPALSWKLEEVRALFEDKPVGTKVSVQYRRDGRTRTAQMKLADLL